MPVLCLNLIDEPNISNQLRNNACLSIFKTILLQIEQQEKSSEVIFWLITSKVDTNLCVEKNVITSFSWNIKRTK